MTTVFIAAPFRKCRAAEDARAELSRAGIRCTSRWIDQACALGGHDSFTAEVAAKAIHENDSDLQSADVCVALYYPGKGCEMFGEVARALEWRKPVYLVVRDSSWPLVAYRPGVTLCASVAAVVETLVPRG